jgi:hypothetical protein
MDDLYGREELVRQGMVAATPVGYTQLYRGPECPLHQPYKGQCRNGG